MNENTPSDAEHFIELAGELTVAWLQNPNVNPGPQDVQSFLKHMHATIIGLGAKPLAADEPVVYEPKVPVRSSVKPDHIVSLIDGKKYKTLKRHLKLNGLTPDEYRARFGLKADYPIVAESYAMRRREIALKLGLGRKATSSAKVVSGKEPGETVTEAAKPAAVNEAAANKKAPAKAKSLAAKAEAPAVPVEMSAPAVPVEAKAAAAVPAKPKQTATKAASPKAKPAAKAKAAPKAKVASKPKAAPTAKPAAKVKATVKPADPASKPPRGKAPAADAQAAVATAAPTTPEG